LSLVCSGFFFLSQRAFMLASVRNKSSPCVHAWTGCQWLEHFNERRNTDRNDILRFASTIERVYLLGGAKLASSSSAMSIGLLGFREFSKLRSMAPPVL
jgi:hypothetical protein